jgi:DNA-binding response OmpR family regulator
MTETRDLRRHRVGVASSAGAHAAGFRGRMEPPGPAVLVVDDDADIRRLMTTYLTLDGFAAEEAVDVAGALETIRRHRPDLVLLDIMMPGRDGLDLLGELRRAGDLPVIMVTAKGDEADRVIGLRLGADDYVVKPFSPAELVARVKAVLRRRGGPPRPARLTAEDLILDLSTREVTVRGRVVATTAKEFDLLAFLASSPSQVFSRDQLLDKVWGSSSEWKDPGTVTEHIRRIRHLIEDDPSHPRRIRTVRSVGYCFQP